MPYPTRRLVIVFLIPAALSLGTLLVPWWEVVLLLDGLLLGVALIDGAIAHQRLRSLSVKVHAPRVWSHQRPVTVVTDIVPRRTVGSRLEVALDVDPDLQMAERVLEAVPEEDHRLELQWRLTPRRRGRYQIRGVHVALRSMLGLWRVHRLLATSHDVQVYPNLRQLNEYELLARTNRLSLIGIRQARRAGGETEFARLRDYVAGDPLSVIDWKATARRETLIARDFTISQAQTIMFMLDAGRMMASTSNGGNQASDHLLDGAINALLMLAHVARKQGDRIGLIVYHRDICRYLPPDGGARQVNRLIQALHDVDVEFVESRHDLAYLHVSRHCQKRSLLIHLTQVLDNVNTDQIVQHLSVLSHRHLPLAVLLRDRDCYGPLQQAPASEEEFFEAAAAASILNWRQSAIDRLENRGVLTLDCFVENLTGELISRYLQIKAKNLL